MQLQHSSHIAKVSVEATCWHILKETTKLVGLFGTIPQESWRPRKGAKPDCVIQSTAKKCTPMQVIKYLEHGRTSTTEEQKWSSFQTNYANNSKSFANRSKSIIRNNLGLFKHSCKYCKISKNSFLYRTSLVAASGIKSNIIGSGPQNAGTPQNPGF